MFGCDVAVVVQRERESVVSDVHIVNRERHRSPTEAQSLALSHTAQKVHLLTEAEQVVSDWQPFPLVHSRHAFAIHRGIDSRKRSIFLYRSREAEEDRERKDDGAGESACRVGGKLCSRQRAIGCPEVQDCHGRTSAETRHVGRRVSRETTEISLKSPSRCGLPQRNSLCCKSENGNKKSAVNLQPPE